MREYVKIYVWEFSAYRSRGDLGDENRPTYRAVGTASVVCQTLVQAHLVLLHFAVSCFTDNAFFFNKLKICTYPVSSKSVGTIFPIAFSHFESLCVTF